MYLHDVSLHSVGVFEFETLESRDDAMTVLLAKTETQEKVKVTKPEIGDDLHLCFDSTTSDPEPMA